MTDQVLNILKFILLGLLYLFFARVLWAVWSEVRPPKQRPVGPQINPKRQPAQVTGTPTLGTEKPNQKPAKQKPAKKVRRSKDERRRATRLVVLEPRQRKSSP